MKMSSLIGSCVLAASAALAGCEEYGNEPPPQYARVQPVQQENGYADENADENENDSANANENENASPNESADDQAEDENPYADEHPSEHPRSCPMGVPGATVSSADVEDGAALDFFTDDQASLSEFRARVSEMASAPEHGGCGCSMMHGQNAPRASVSIEEIDGGVALVFRAKDPRQLGAVRNMVNAAAARLRQGGGCGIAQ